MLALPTIWALVALAPMVAMVELAAGISSRDVAIIPDPATESLVLATAQPEIVFIAVVRVIFDEAPALRVADMALLLSVAIDLLSVALPSIVQVATMDPMPPLDKDSTIELPDYIPIGPTLALLDLHSARLALLVSLPAAALSKMLLELAMAPVLPLAMAVLVIFIELEAHKSCRGEALGTLKMYQLVASADSKKSRPRMIKKRAITVLQDVTSRIILN